MSKEITKKDIINEVVKNMETVGTYKTEYDRLIEIYSGMLHQYISFEKQFEESGYRVEEEYTNKAGATNMRKVPLYTAMESLRKDIASYSDRLQLNPKSLNFEPPKKEIQGSPLDRFLVGL